MAFTCPDCLWTSHHPQDEQHSYCGHCHEFKGRNFSPTLFQRQVIRALRGNSPHAELYSVVAAQRVAQQATMDEIRADLTPMLGATRLSYEARMILQYVLLASYE